MSDRIKNMRTSDVWVFGRAPKICCGFDTDADTRMFMNVCGKSVEVPCSELKRAVKSGEAYPAIPIPAKMAERIHKVLRTTNPALDAEFKAVAEKWL